MSSQPTASASNRMSWTRALLWKEFRQVRPLMLTVLGLAFGILLIILVSASFSSPRGLKYDQGFWFLFMSMPMMYATGVGILLVGTEKESRSLHWFRSLPVSGQQIAWSKLFVALTSLAMIWLIALVAWSVFAGTLGGNSLSIGSLDVYKSDSGGWLLLLSYVMVSLFLCLAGIAFAWRFESQMVSLVMLIPAALAVWLLAYGLAELAHRGNSDLSQQRLLESLLYIGSLFLGCLIATLYGWKVSQRALSSLTAPTKVASPNWVDWPSFGLGSVLGVREEAGAAEAWSLWPTISPISSMLWQMIRQNWLWWGLLAFAALVTLLIGSDAVIHIPGKPIHDRWIGQIFLPVMLLSGLLGILVFQSDGTQQRIKFYADRGVSPTVLWFTRHWIPVVIVMGIALTRYLMICNARSFEAPWILIDAMALLATSLASYAVGQWVSQFINSPILATITLPAVLVTNLAFCIFANIGMGAPVWLLSLTFLIPIVATWWMMRPWMERRIDWRFHLHHGGFALAALVIPMIPGLWKIWTLPSMPSQLRATLTQLAVSNPPVTRGLRIDEKRNRPATILKGVNDSVEHHADLLSATEEARRTFVQQLIEQNGKADLNDFLDHWLSLHGLIAELARMRTQMERSSSESPSQATMDNLAEYRKILANIPHWVLALRSRHTIEDCDSAEKIELVALTHCLGDGAARRLGNEVYASLAKLLSDDRSRDQARKVALASTWWASQRFSNSNRDVSMELGSYNMRYLLYDSDLQLSNRDGYIPSSIELRRARDLFVSDLWSLLELSPENVQAMTENQHPIRRFSRRADWGLTDLVDGVLNLQSTAPASAWRGAWESIAKQLPPEVSDHE